MKKFLIADDSDAKAMMLEGMIKKSKLHAKIIRARTTEEANKLVSEHPDIAFAFIDYEIPSELGPSIIKHLKGTNPKARVALVSSSNSEKYQANAKEAGAEAFVCTSFDSDEVEKSIVDLLEKWSNPQKSLV